MLNRLVKQIHPIIENQKQELKPFADFLHFPNLILLGEPGAGKTYSFEAASQFENTKRLTARNFKVSARNYKNQVVYIDALDEKRSRKDDCNLIEDIVEKISDIEPTKLRLSCRAADWLGNTDLEIFKAYFNDNYCVVELQGLSENEIENILKAQGVNDISHFLANVREKNLGFMLINPQTLIMLADVAIKHGQLPNNKKELYEKATDILLTEHNENHQRKSLANYPLSQIKEAAGFACATLLISDADGISLKPIAHSYRDIPYPDSENPNPDMVFAALTKRAFVMLNQEQEQVTYSHRTIAEYLAACFLVDKIRDGLPLGRVRSLLEIEGYPATELRGLYAWLTHLLPEYAPQLVTADPYGALVYGDVSCLSLANKKALLNALVALADKDPWFRRDDWTSAPLGALSTPEMAEDFKAILLARPKQLHLLSIVFDAIANGKQQLELEQILLDIFCNESLNHGERARACECLINATPHGKELVVKFVKEQFQLTPDNIRLKAKIISSLYERNFNSDDVAQLIKDYKNNCHANRSIGDLWKLSFSLPIDDIPKILDQLVGIKEETHSDALYEISSFCYYSLSRYLKNTVNVDAKKLWSWLSSLYFSERYYGSKDEIKDWLSKNSDYVLSIFEVALKDFDITGYNSIWSFWNDFYPTIIIQFDISKLIKLAYYLIESKSICDEKDKFIFHLAFHLAINLINPPDFELFEKLKFYGDSHPELVDIIESTGTSNITDWRKKEAIRKINENKKQEIIIKNDREDFERDIDLIRTGQRFNWLTYIANVYFARYSNVDKSKTPRERLAQQLGEENVEIALEGLRTVINRSDLPTPLEVVNLYIENKYREWWYTILAGITECYYQQSNLDCYSESTLKSALALNLLHSLFFFHEKNASRQFTPNWQLALFQKKPELVQSVYLEVINVLAKTQKDFVQDIREICENSYLINNRAKIILTLLTNYPNIAHQELNTLLFNVLFFSEIKEELNQLIETTLASEIELTLEQRTLWLAAGFFVDFEKFKIQIENSANEYLFQLIDFIEKSSWIEDKRIFHEISVTQSIFLLNLIGQRFANVEHKIVNGAYRSSLNEKAAKFVKEQINKLSTFTNAEALNALTDLINEPKLESYRDYLKHAAANQAALHRKQSFQQPNWRQTIEALANGKPANIQDLYALTIEHLKDACEKIQNKNTNIFKDFWNQEWDDNLKKHIPSTPKTEDICRNRLIELLEPKFTALDVNIESERLMVNGNRADIALINSAKQMVLPIEAKRDYNKDLWTACENQLDKLYTGDPHTHGYGIYVVFWFGDKRLKGKGGIPKLPDSIKSKPTSAEQLETALTSLIKEENKKRLSVVVIDVTSP